MITRVRLERKLRNMRQKELAEKAGIEPGMLSKIENGWIKMGDKTISKLQHALGLSEEEAARLGDPVDETMEKMLQ